MMYIKLFNPSFDEMVDVFVKTCNLMGTKLEIDKGLLSIWKGTPCEMMGTLLIQAKDVSIDKIGGALNVLLSSKKVKYLTSEISIEFASSIWLKKRSLEMKYEFDIVGTISDLLTIYGNIWITIYFRKNGFEVFFEANDSLKENDLLKFIEILLELRKINSFKIGYISKENDCMYDGVNALI